MKLTTKTARHLKDIIDEPNILFKNMSGEIINFKNELKKISEECNLNYKFSEEMFTLRVLKLIKEIESVKENDQWKNRQTKPSVKGYQR